MRTQIDTYNVYRFEELDDSGKEKALDNYRDINTNYEWWDYTFEDIKIIGELMGIEIDNIYFSGFCSQGDGACFEGHYSYKKGGLKALKEYAPRDTELHRIANELQKIQAKCFYKLTANVKHSGHYSHKYCTDIDIDTYESGEYNISNDTEEAIKELLRDFMEWIYRLLEKEHDYLTSEEAIIETFEANNYEFTEDGKMA